MKHGCGRGTASLLDIVLEGGADRNGVEGGCSRRHLDDIVDDRGDYSTRRTAVPTRRPSRTAHATRGRSGRPPRRGESTSVAAYVVLRYDNETTTTTRVVHQSHKWYVQEVPYVPSYLAYREMDAVIDLIDRQVKSRPDLTPDVVLVDGNGVWHERKAGIATFVGVRTGLPTVGIGKTFYSIGGMMTRRDMHQRVIDALDAWYNEESMQERDNGRSIGATSGRGTRLANRRLLLDVVSTAPPAQSVEGGRDVTRRGLAVPVERILEALHQSANGIAIAMKDPRATAEDDDDDDEPLAYALVGHGGNNAAHRNGVSSNPKYCARGSKNPIYISIGSNISLLDAVYLCSQSCVVRIPEPIREADSYCRRLVRERRKGLPTISNGD